MNNRIQELLNQSLDRAVPETWSTLSYEQMTKLSQVFAELIIKECTKLIEESTEDDEYWSRVTGAESIMAIEEHFGVEE